MRLVILDDYNLASEWAAKYIRNRIIQFKPSANNFFTLGLPTGSTPYGCYQKLIEYYRCGELSFKFVKTFNMDEYVGLPRAHPESYHSYMWNNFFKYIDIDPANAHILDGNAEDLEAECKSYERKIAEAGGIHLFVGGIGPDGHIAFNEPGSSLVSRTRVKTLAKDTIVANARFFGNDLSKVPTMALTVGVGTVMDAKEVLARKSEPQCGLVMIPLCLKTLSTGMLLMLSPAGEWAFLHEPHLTPIILVTSLPLKARSCRQLDVRLSSLAHDSKVL
uniref:Glucosamine-6-phosphate isomerase n=1 Tax=Hippocampus comes TaxID=109280 RepID=A0A3Q2YJK9_HIPCM